MPDHDPTRTADPTAGGADGGGPVATATAPAGYDLLGELGRGGMGVVYRARDLALGREVAVKVLSERYAPGSRTAARFLEEARITGQLQHPGVPAVHQAGTLPDGRPFLAMKLIKGRTLEELLQDARPGAGDNLAVFEAVCQAVAYAHAHAVIHRDLKPANVMVGAFGEVQVMDWGLAKVLSPLRPAAVTTPEAAETIGTEIRSLRDSDGSFTQAGSLLGTPAYMPPEQAAGESDKIDRRSDVFGLGAILCVMLTGKPPFTGKDAEAVRLNSVRARLGDAFERLDGCGAEPDLVALAKRCLAAEPDDRPADAGEVARAVAGLRAAAEERARRAELDRAKAEVRAAEQRKRRRVQAALAASLVAVLAAVAGGLWWADRQATGRETERRAEADQNRQAARTALDQAEAALQNPNPVYGEIDAALAQVGPRLEAGGAEDLRPRFDGLANDRRMLQWLDDIDQRHWMWVTDRKGYDTAYARENYPLAFQKCGLDLGSEPPSALAEKVRRSPIAARLTAALDSWLAVGGGPEVLGLIDALDPSPDRSALRRAFAARDGNAVAGAVAHLDGRLLPPDFARFIGGHDLTPAVQARRILRAAQAAYPSHFGLAIQAALRAPEGQADEAVTYYRVALAIRPTNPACYNNLGIALADRKDFDGAIAAYRTAIRLDPKLAKAHHNLSNVLRAKKDFAGAAAASREAIRLDPNYVWAHNGLGHALTDKGELDGAAAAYRGAIRLDPMFAKGHSNLGVVLHRKRDLPGALAEYREAIRLAPNAALAHNGLGTVLVDRKEWDAAFAEFQEAVRLDPNYALAHSNLGNILLERKDPDGAVAECREAVRLDPNYAPARNGLGNALAARKEWDAAVAAYREAARLDPTLAAAHYNLGNLLLQRQDWAGAAVAMREVVRLDPTNARAHAGLGHSLGRLGEPFAALAEMEQVARLNPALMADPKTGFRANAALYAALAAGGAAKDSPPAAERPGLRRKALGWLTDDLAACRQLLEEGPAARPVVHQKMLLWLGEAGPASGQPRAGLEQLPADERAGWEKLLAAIRELRDATAPPPKPEG